MKKHQIITSLAVVFFIQFYAHAQGAPAKDATTSVDNTSINEIDSLLKQNSAEDADTSNAVINKPMTKKEIKKLNISDYSNIISESSYNDYSIVQRNYMPKSNRTQVKLGVTSVTNDVFYSNMGFSLGATYYLNETWGAGVNAVYLNSNRNSYAENIKTVQLVNIENLVTLKGAYGLSVYYTPIYGKWSLVNQRVIPFEMYLQGGLAQITNQSNATTSAFTAGLGQLISMTRSSALDVNLNWYFYTTQNINHEDQSNNSMLLTVAYTMFWPKPNYR
ncbi:MAG: outer membrane beta-barrel domain-containing protein [Pseudobdellovibrio sp.]